MFSFRRFILRRARSQVIPDELHVCVCPPATRGVPRDDHTCWRCTRPISPSHDELARTQGRPISVVGR